MRRRRFLTPLRVFRRRAVVKALLRRPRQTQPSPIDSAVTPIPPTTNSQRQQITRLLCRLTPLLIVIGAGYFAAIAVSAWRDHHVSDSSLFSSLAFGDVTPDIQGPWAYDTRPNFLGMPPPPPETTPSQQGFPGLMTFETLSGDIGVLGKKTLPLLHYTPLVPAAAFLTLVMLTSRRFPRRWNRHHKDFRLLPDVFGQLGSAPPWSQPPWPFFAATLRFLYYFLPTFIWVKIYEFVYTKINIWTFILFATIAAGGVTLEFILLDLPHRRLSLRTSRHILIALMIGVPLSASAAIVVLDTHRLIFRLDKRPPRLFPPLQDTDGDPVVSKVGKLLSGRGQLPTDDDIARARLIVARHTPDGPHNPVSLNLCRCSWYIAWLIVGIGYAVLSFHWRPNARSANRGSGVRLFVALTGYIAIGVVFGMIYYDYFLLDVARYHVLLATYFVPLEKEEKAAEALPPSDSEAIKVREKILANESARDKLEAILASAYFASSVFSQDAPTIGVSSNAPEKVEGAVFSCTFQFTPRNSVIADKLTLRYPYTTEAHDDPAALSLPGDSQNTEKAVERAERPKLTSPSQCSVPGLRDSPDTNATSLAFLKMFVCEESNARGEGTDRGFSVHVKGVADCSGTAPENQGYAEARARAVLEKARSLVASARKQRENHRLGSLALAIENAQRDNVVQPTDGGPCRVNPYYAEEIWPRSKRDTPDPEDEVGKRERHPARAAVLTIERTAVDATDRVKMESGLSRRTTLSDMVYFSFVTFTTTGYGDMKAVSGPVRFCVIMENILEILFTAVFFAAAMAVVTRE